jgi:hypothetical protein
VERIEEIEMLQKNKFRRIKRNNYGKQVREKV